MTSNPKIRRLLTIILPILSLTVSASIVIHQYARRASLTRQLAADEREFIALQKKLPKSARPAREAKDEHGHHAHND